MMKNLTLALGLMIIASPAFATTARLNSLGENGATGSYYIQDQRNIFLNPAQIVKYKKKFVLEFAPTDGATAQGLFTNTFGDYTYGLSLNNNSVRATTAVAQANALLSGTAGAGTLLAPNRTLEAFFAGEGAMNWGLSVFYSGNGDQGVLQSGTAGVNSAQTGDQRTSSLFGARAGVEVNNFAVFTTVGITSDTKVLNTVSPELKGKVSVDVGATYTMDNTVAFAKFTTYGTDVKTAASTTEVRNQVYGLGLGHKWEATKTLSLFGRLEADYSKQTVTSAASTKTWDIPLVIAAEAQALNWLALRGSVKQSLAGQQTGNAFATTTAQSGAGYRVNTGSTVLAAGAGLTFGEVQIDATLSTAVAGSWGVGQPLANTAFTYNF